jgi:hypothetical protein
MVDDAGHPPLAGCVVAEQDLVFMVMISAGTASDETTMARFSKCSSLACPSSDRLAKSASVKSNGFIH